MEIWESRVVFLGKREKKREKKLSMTHWTSNKYTHYIEKNKGSNQSRWHDISIFLSL